MTGVANPNFAGSRLKRVAIAFAAVLLSICILPGISEAAKGKKKKKKGQVVKVMTRNVYLGADLGPGLSAGSTDEFVDAAGEIVNQVDRTNFPLRSNALAAEILQRSPDLVGLQEVAWWRVGPFSLTQPSTQTEYDFLQLLLDKLNAGKERYRAIVVKEEFDFETPVNDSGPPGGLAQVDHDARLTMRDVILAKVGKKVKVKNPQSATFDTLLKVTPAGQNVNVTRGWTALDAKVGKSKWFRFVNTHFEAFDSSGNNQTNKGTSLGKGQVRQAQALSLVTGNGPATGKLPVILVGDLNSDDDTVQPNGDHLAYNAIVGNGFRPVDTSNPMSCCLNDPELVGGALSDFDHHIDHILTDNKRIRFLRGFVTGLAKVNGLQPSDHAGVTSELRVPRKAKKKRKK